MDYQTDDPIDLTNEMLAKAKRDAQMAAEIKSGIVCIHPKVILAMVREIELLTNYNEQRMVALSEIRRLAQDIVEHSEY